MSVPGENPPSASVVPDDADTAPEAKQENASTDDLLRQLLAQQREHRAEVAQLREEVSNQRRAPTPPSSVTLSADELREQRMNEVNDHDYYCPACGRLYDYRRECSGTGEAPHPALEVVATDELKGDDESKHTAAPGVNP